jgi:hypothetical protein
MLRFLVYLAIAVAIAYFATTVQLGRRTLVGHIRAIWQTEEVRELKDGVKEKAAPAVDRLERGVKAGVKEASGDRQGTPAEANR